MPVIFFLDTKTPTGRIILGCVILAALLILAFLLLFFNLPDANAFNNRVEQIFVENDALTTPESIKLLEIMAQSGTAFSDALQGYRFVIFILMLLSAALLLSSMYFLIHTYGLARRMAQVEQSGIVINSLVLNREERIVHINHMAFELTESTVETLSILCEARLDDDVMSGANLDATLTGKSSYDSDEATGATRVKRLRDNLGNQIVSQMLIKNVSKKGYVLSIPKDAIKLV